MRSLFHFQTHIFGKRSLSAVDKLMSIAAVAQPLMATPQIVQIYSTNDATGVSLLTWLAFLIFGVIFLVYGIVHNIRPLIVTQVLWFVVDLLVVVGILLYN